MEKSSEQQQQVEEQQQQVEQAQAPEEDNSLEQATDLTKEEEDNLMQFLMKVSKACETDSSVPDFVGSQVAEWLNELKNEKKDEVEKIEEEH